MFTVYSDFS